MERDLTNDITMEPNNVEYDFKEWFEYSRSKEHKAQANLLKSVLLTKQSQGTIEISEKVLENEIYYCVEEKYNPVLLYINSTSCQEFYSHICNFFPDEETEFFEVKHTHERVNVQINTKSKNSDRVNIFFKISSEKPFIHSLRFSFLSLLVLQVLILPGNISDYKLPSWSYLIFLGVFTLTFYLCIWSYSKVFTDIKSYNDIFKFSIIFCNSFFLLVFVEVMIIDSIVIDNFSFLFSLILIVLGQLIGVLFSLFFAVVIYFIKGGKMVDVR